MSDQTTKLLTSNITPIENTKVVTLQGANKDQDKVDKYSIKTFVPELSWLGTEN